MRNEFISELLLIYSRINKEDSWAQNCILLNGQMQRWIKYRRNVVALILQEEMQYSIEKHIVKH